MIYKSFRDMPVWQNANQLSVKVFKLTIGLPRSEDYGLTSQIRKSANSVSACISEGFGRNTGKDKSSFYIIARGSAYETQSHLVYGNQVGYFDPTESENIFIEYNDLIFELNKLLKALRDI